MDRKNKGKGGSFGAVNLVSTAKLMLAEHANEGQAHGFGGAPVVTGRKADSVIGHCQGEGIVLVVKRDR